MKVKELIEELQRYDSDLEVSIERDATEDFDGGLYVVESVYFDKEANSLIIED